MRTILPQDPRARREAAVLVLLLLVFAGSLLPALVAARQQVRDGLRRARLIELKRALELVNNALGHYPMPPDEPRARCSSSLDVRDWFFGNHRAAVLRKHLPEIPRDPSFPGTWDYRYCVSVVDALGATAWTVRTQLERRQDPRAAFDAEENHNFYTRVVRNGPATFYDICGGTLTCGAPPRLPD